MPPSKVQERVDAAWTTISRAVDESIVEKDDPLALATLVPVVADSLDEVHLVRKRQLVTSGWIDPPGGQATTWGYEIQSDTIEREFRLRVPSTDLADTGGGVLDRVREWARSARQSERDHVLATLVDPGPGRPAPPTHTNGIDGIRWASGTLHGVGALRVLSFVEIEGLAPQLETAKLPAEVHRAPRPPGSDERVQAIVFRTGSGPRVLRARDLSLGWVPFGENVELVLFERYRLDLRDAKPPAYVLLTEP